MLPASTPEEIDSVLRSISGRYELTRSRRRRQTASLVVINGIVCAIFVFAAWASRDNPLGVFFGIGVIAAVIETAYKVAKLYRVTEISPTLLEDRWPIQFLSWRLEASELRLVDIDVGQRDDYLRLVPKTSRKRRLPIPRSVSARLRAASRPPASPPARPPA